jgi:hypothetical protein
MCKPTKKEPKKAKAPSKSKTPKDAGVIPGMLRPGKIIPAEEVFPWLKGEGLRVNELPELPLLTGAFFRVAGTDESGRPIYVIETTKEYTQKDEEVPITDGGPGAWMDHLWLQLNELKAEIEHIQDQISWRRKELG